MSLSPDTLTLLVAILGTGLALAGLILRTTARHDADMREFRRAMDTFRAEMQRLAERQSHVEGRLDERHGAGAD